MILKITDKWMKKLSEIKEISGLVSENDFIHQYNKADAFGDVTTIIYKCDFGDEMIVDDNDYSNNTDLQEFVNQGYLEIV
jgi:hypothetical protein